MSEILIACLGGLTSILSSFFGAFASGGSVLILMSSLIIFTPYPYISLLATAKIAGMAMVLMASRIHYKKTKVHLPMIAIMTSASLIGMIGATYLVQTYTNETFFERVIGFMLISMGVYLFFSKKEGLIGSGRNSFTKSEFLEMSAVLLLVGFINGFSGGMGFVLNAYLVLRLQMSFIEATAYTMISGLLVVSIQAIYLISTVQTNHYLLIGVVVGSLMGGYLGTHLQYLQGSQTVKWISITMMLMLGTAAFFH